MTLRVRPLVNVPPAGKVPLDGLKVHDNPVGRLGQLNAAGPRSLLSFW